MSGMADIKNCFYRESTGGKRPDPRGSERKQKASFFRESAWKNRRIYADCWEDASESGPDSRADKEGNIGL